MGVEVGVAVGVFVGVAVGVGLGVAVGMGVGVFVGVAVAVDVGVGLGVGVRVDVGVAVGDGLGVAVFAISNNPFAFTRMVSPFVTGTSAPNTFHLLFAFNTQLVLLIRNVVVNPFG